MADLSLLVGEEGGGVGRGGGVLTDNHYWSWDLRANERPQNKLHLKGTYPYMDIETYRPILPTTARLVKRWKVTYDRWKVTCDIWHVTHDTWHLTSDIWHLKSARKVTKIQRKVLKSAQKCWKLSNKGGILFYWCYYLHTPKYLVSPICGIFLTKNYFSKKKSRKICGTKIQHK